MTRHHAQYATGVVTFTGTDGTLVACDGGTVTWVQYWNGSYYDNQSYGNCVKITHANGYTTLYAHLSSISVTQGQLVSRGQQIGLSGSTGNSSGPHLHLEVVGPYGGIYPGNIGWASS